MLLLGCPDGPTRALRDRLGPADLVPFPPLGPMGGTWEWSWQDDLLRWGELAGDGDPRPGIVVCCWGAGGAGGAPARPFVELGAGDWVVEVERQLALLFLAVRAAARRCAPGGSVVVVVERPAALGSVGRSSLVAVAEGVISVTRSVAAAEARRGVRANVVATAPRTAPAEGPGMPPARAGCPGRVGDGVVGAVRHLLSDAAAGMTASVLAPDGGGLP